MRALALLCAIGAWSCGPAPRDLPWSIAFADGADRALAVAFEAWIEQGTCESSDRLIYREPFRLGGAAPTPPALGEGEYAFRARARDAECEWFAEGCTDYRVPADDAPTVIVTLSRVAREPACPPDECGAGGACPGDPPTGETLDPPGYASPADGAVTGSVLSEARQSVRFRWAEVPGATSYALQVAPCAGPLDSCGFETAEVDVDVGVPEHVAALRPPSSAPVGARYAWRLQACAAECSRWSRVRWLDAGRQASDFDGDGRADVAAGAPASTPGGRVLAYPGAPAGPGAGREVFSSDAAARAGAALASGDLDGDGYADLLVGVPFATRGALNEGRVVLLRGGPSGLDPAAVEELPHPDPTTGSTFGDALAVLGDVDGDGDRDVVVGAPQHGGQGVCWVFLVEPGAPSAWTPVRLDNPSPRPNGRFGAAVGGVDVDGDGLTDVVVGAPGNATNDGDAGSGFVYVFRGVLGAAPDREPTDALEHPEAQPDAGFGASLTGLDFDGDGGLDLGVGAPGHDGGSADSGRVYLYFGALARGLGAPVTIASRGGAGSRFGAALGAGDVQGDGLDDLIIGAPEFATDMTAHGGSFVYFGREDGGPDTAAARTFEHPMDVAGARLGGAVTGRADVDGDGVDDLLAGAPGAGQVFYYQGGARLEGSPAPTGRIDAPAGATDLGAALAP